jgi:3-hydroxyacyl-CoA dehydrogenase
LNDLVKFASHGHVAVVTIDNPPVNALSPGVPEGIVAAIETASKDAEVRAVVVTGAGRTFVAGADIREFGKITSGEKPLLNWYPAFLAIEDCPKPVVMAIHGTVLGGGLELAMAGHYRVAAPGTQVGQPEVKLGIIPGAGGTQRLPRLAGVAKAVEMCAFGEPIDAQGALQAGILDKIIEGDLLREAIEFARGVAGKPIRKTRERNEKLGDAKGNEVIFASAREQARKTLHGQMAPLAAIDAIEAATKLSFEEGCREEAELFRVCLFSTQSKAMIYAFFGERSVSKIPDVPLETKPAEIRRVALINGAPGVEYSNAGISVVDDFKQADLIVIGAPVRDIDAIAASTGRPDIVVGHQSVGRLLEIVRGQATSAEAIAGSLALARKMKKVGVVVRGESIGERVFAQYAREIALLANEGTPPKEAEQALAAMATEAARVLKEGVALRAVDIDIVGIHGYGFPPWRGGPMFWADSADPKN